MEKVKKVCNPRCQRQVISRKREWKGVEGRLFAFFLKHIWIVSLLKLYNLAFLILKTNIKEVLKIIALVGVKL